MKSMWPNFAPIGLDRGWEKQLQKRDWTLIRIREEYNEKGEGEGWRRRGKRERERGKASITWTAHLAQSLSMWWV